MRLTEVKAKLREAGILDGRELFCYATAAGTLEGKTFQTLVGCAFTEDALLLLKAELDGTTGQVHARYPYGEIKNFVLKNRFWYSCCSFGFGIDHMKFYNYDKKIFLQGFTEAGIYGDVHDNTTS